MGSLAVMVSAKMPSVGTEIKTDQIDILTENKRSMTDFLNQVDYQQTSGVLKVCWVNTGILKILNQKPYLNFKV